MALMLPLVAACGPMSLDQAESQCLLRARQAVNPLAGGAIGAGSAGLYTGDLSLTLSSDTGRDPSAVFDTCVIQKTGQLPRQPLTSRPDWRR